MKKLRTDCEGEKKKGILKGMKILKIEKSLRFFEKNSLKKLGQPSLKKKSDTRPTLVVTLLGRHCTLCKKSLHWSVGCQRGWI